MDNTPYILIIGGIIAASWLLEKITRLTPLIGKPVSGIVRISSFFGFFVGFLLILTGIGAWSIQAFDINTRYLLIITGLALFLKPLKEIPWAALVGLAVGVLCVGFIFFTYPLPETVSGISSVWIYLLIFFFPALIVYSLFKFIEDLLRLIAIFLTLKPIAICLGLVCIIQGVLLLLNRSLFTLLS